MRSLIFSTLSAAQENNQTLKAVKGIYVANSLGTDPVPSRPPTPFLMIVEQPEVAVQAVRKTGRSHTTEFDIRCYDKRGDYMRIDSILRAARDSLLALDLPALSPSGYKATDIRWMGTTLDSEDPDLDMIFKATTIRFVTNA